MSSAISGGPGGGAAAAAGGAAAVDSATGEAIDPAQVSATDEGASARAARAAREEFCGEWTNIRSASPQ